MTMRCLLNTTHAHNVQSFPGRCNKTMNTYMTKAGNHITEVISDFGRGWTTKAEIFDNNKIIQTLTDGSTVTFTKNLFGDVLVKEGATETLSNDPKLWNKLLSSIKKGF